MVSGLFCFSRISRYLVGPVTYFYILLCTQSSFFSIHCLTEGAWKFTFLLKNLADVLFFYTIINRARV